MKGFEENILYFSMFLQNAKKSLGNLSGSNSSFVIVSTHRGTDVTNKGTKLKASCKEKHNTSGAAFSRNQLGFMLWALNALLLQFTLHKSF